MKSPLTIIGALLPLLLGAGLLAQEKKTPDPQPPAPATVSFADNGQKLGTGDSWYVQLVDINGDGLLEAYFDGAIWLNDGQGHFTRGGLSFGPANRPAFFADFNGDGFVDAVCDGFVYLNDGKFHFSEKRRLPTGMAMLNAHLSDVNGDGTIDIVVADASGDRILLNDGKGNFTDTGKSLGGWGQCSYAVGDINGDHIPDIYVAIPHTPPPDMKRAKDKLWLGDGRGGFTEAAHEIQAGEHRGVVLADWNGDGALDLLIASPGGARVYLNDGKGIFTDSGQKLGSGGVVAADFNGDGSLDVFFLDGRPTDNGKPNTVWLNDGKGHFTDSGLRLGNANSVDAAVGDLNGDGKPDVFVANVKNVIIKAGAGFNEVWLNTTDIAASYLTLDGAVLGEVTQHDAMMLSYHVPMLVDRLQQSGTVIPEAVHALLETARGANRKRDYYTAFRLYARAAGLARGPARVESSEVAASIQLSLNRAIFSRGERITLTLRPLFSLGHPLSGTYNVHTWLENKAGVIPGTEQQRVVTELKPTSFDFPTESLSDGVTAVGYRLDSGGVKLVEFKHAVLIAKDSQQRLDGLKAKVAAVHSSAGAAALETLEYQLQGLERERSRFDGNWQRLAHPLGMYLSRLNFAVMGRPTTDFPVFVGRIRYPEDVSFAEALADASVTGGNPLVKQTGDMQQAYRATDGELVRYRVFVPNPARTYPLILALHSGAGEGTYFEWEASQSDRGKSPENRFKQLARERGYIVVCPNGRGDFASARGEADVLAVLDRVESLYSIDRNRVSLTGWSIGSSASWRIALAHPDLFKAVAPVAGAAVWLDRENTAKAAGLRIRFFAAEKDPSIAEARRTSALAKELLPGFVYLEYADTSHDAIWSKALPAIFDFFDTVAANPPASRKASFQGLGDFPGGTFEPATGRGAALADFNGDAVVDADAGIG